MREREEDWVLHIGGRWYRGWWEIVDHGTGTVGVVVKGCPIFHGRATLEAVRGRRYPKSLHIFVRPTEVERGNEVNDGGDGVRVYHWWPGREYKGACPIPAFLVRRARAQGSRYLTYAFDGGYFGTAFCCPKDVPRRRIGREIALGRLQKARAEYPLDA